MEQIVGINIQSLDGEVARAVSLVDDMHITPISPLSGRTDLTLGRSPLSPVGRGTHSWSHHHSDAASSAQRRLLLLVNRYDRTVTDDDLDLGLHVFRQTAKGLRGITDIVDIPVAWDAVVHPLGVEGIERLTAEDSYGLRAINGRETDGDRTVAVQIWTEPGTDIDTSDAWQMVRTIRFDSTS